MTILGLIPARGGSKRIPRKNLFMLAGKPLLQYTIDAAEASRRLDHIVLSSDEPEIAALGLKNRIETWIRPFALAQDDTPMIDVLKYALELKPADIVVLLQPTSPLRTAAHIDAAIDLIEDADSVVSVVRERHRLVRNGPAVLVTRRSVIESGKLMGPECVFYEMDRRSSIDIDDLYDMALAEYFIGMKDA